MDAASEKRAAERVHGADVRLRRAGAHRHADRRPREWHLYRPRPPAPRVIILVERRIVHDDQVDASPRSIRLAIDSLPAPIDVAAVTTLSCSRARTGRSVRDRPPRTRPTS